jgi:KaiC/GvpD/RAD55 family RecA-like ATPase
MTYALNTDASYKNITKKQFDALASDFLSTQNKYDRDSCYITTHEMAESVMQTLSEFLFKEEQLKAERYEMYEQLKKEFES